MNTVNSFRRSVRLLRQRALAKIAKRTLVGTVALEQRRQYRTNDRFFLARNNAQIGAGSTVLTDGTFNPRYDERHYKSYYKFDEPTNPETRRRITQDTADHQKRQVRIIEENKLKWKNRSEPKPPGAVGYKYEYYYSTKAARDPPKKQKRQTPAEKYSRRRRHQRQTEVERQERELDESRKNYKLPKSEIEERTVETSEEKPASRAWLEKQAREEEAQYWHTWYTCPSERRTQNAEEESVEEEEQSPGYSRNQRRGLVKPPQNYDGSVRRYQTHSTQQTSPSDNQWSPEYDEVEETPMGRRPNGMQKQYLLAKDFIQLTTPSEDNKQIKVTLSTPLLQSHIFKAPFASYATNEEEMEQIEDIELPKQPPRTRQAWQGLPRPVYMRFHGIKRAIARQNRKPKTVKSVGERAQSPSFRMTVKSNALQGKQMPIGSCSRQLTVKPTNLANCGFGRQSVCEAWHVFTNAYNQLKVPGSTHYLSKSRGSEN